MEKKSEEETGEKYLSDSRKMVFSLEEAEKINKIADYDREVKIIETKKLTHFSTLIKFKHIQ